MNSTLAADLINPFKKLIQIRIPTMSLAPGHCEVDAEAIVLQSGDPDERNGEGFILQPSGQDGC